CTRGWRGALRDRAGESAEADRDAVSMRMQSARAAVALAVATVIAACVSLAGCNKGDATPTPVVAVQAEHPATGAIAEHIPADAVLAPLAQAAISPKISAPVRHFYVQRGSHVKAG